MTPVIYKVAIRKPLNLTVINDITDYFLSEFANDAYSDFIAN